LDLGGEEKIELASKWTFWPAPAPGDGLNQT
jgi:hypothetical protein